MYNVKERMITPKEGITLLDSEKWIAFLSGVGGHIASLLNAPGLTVFDWILRASAVVLIGGIAYNQRKNIGIAILLVVWLIYNLVKVAFLNLLKPCGFLLIGIFMGTPLWLAAIYSPPSKELLYCAIAFLCWVLTVLYRIETLVSDYPSAAAILGKILLTKEERESEGPEYILDEKIFNGPFNHFQFWTTLTILAVCHIVWIVTLTIRIPCSFVRHLSHNNQHA